MPNGFEQNPLPEQSLTPSLARILGIIRKRYVYDEICERLPSERQLERTLGVSRTVIRPCLKLLEKSGEIYRQPGGRIRFTRRVVAACEPTSWGDPFDFASPTLPSRVAYLTFSSMDFCAGTSSRVRGCYERWVQQFNARHERIQIHLEDWPDEERAFNGFPPNLDVAVHTSSIAASLHRLGQIRGLDDLIASEGEAPLGLSVRGVADSPTPSVPFGSTFAAMAVNRSLWHECSPIPLEELNEWDWPTCLDIAETMAGRLGGRSFHLCGLVPILCSSGIWLFDNPVDADFNHAGDTLRRLIRIGEASPGEAGRADVAAGRLGMTPVSTTTQSQLEERYGQSIAVVPFPCNRKGWIPRYDLGIVLRADCQWVPEAWKFIAFLLHRAQQNDLVAINHCVPACHAAMLQDAPDDDDAALLAWRRFSFARSRPIDCAVPVVRKIESDILMPHLLSWMRIGEFRDRHLHQVLEQVASSRT